VTIELNNLTALICTPTGAGGKLRFDRDTVFFDPEDFQEKKLQGQVSLHNESLHPIAVTGATVPCSCMKFEFEPSIVEPGESLYCTYEILADGWGPGVNVKKVGITGPTGVLTHIAFSGAATSFAARRSFYKRQLSSQMEVPLLCGPAPFVVQTRIQLNEEPLGQIGNNSFTVHSETAAAEAELSREKDIFYLSVSCMLNEEYLRAISEGGEERFIIRVVPSGESVAAWTVGCSVSRPIYFDYDVDVGSDGREATVQIEIPADGISQWELAAIEFNGVEATSSTMREGASRWVSHIQFADPLDEICIGRVVFESPGQHSFARKILIGE
jgi:hypothetical protein